MPEGDQKQEGQEGTGGSRRLSRRQLLAAAGGIAVTAATGGFGLGKLTEAPRGASFGDFEFNLLSGEEIERVARELGSKHKALGGSADSGTVIGKIWLADLDPRVVYVPGRKPPYSVETWPLMPGSYGFSEGTLFLEPLRNYPETKIRILQKYDLDQKGSPPEYAFANAWATIPMVEGEKRVWIQYGGDSWRPPFRQVWFEEEKNNINKPVDLKKEDLRVSSFPIISLGLLPNEVSLGNSLRGVKGLLLPREKLPQHEYILFSRRHQLYGRHPDPRANTWEGPLEHFLRAVTVESSSNPQISPGDYLALGFLVDKEEQKDFNPIDEVGVFLFNGQGRLVAFNSVETARYPTKPSGVKVVE